MKPSPPKSFICPCGTVFIGGRNSVYCPKCKVARKRAHKLAEYQRHREAYVERASAWLRNLTPEQRAERADRLRFSGLRAATLDRDGHVCRECGTDQSLIVHHVNRRESRNEIDRESTLDVLITLCRRCHIKIHREAGHLATR
jgi:5-methylcytosine-specific restriction endonuclease McrA